MPFCAAITAVWEPASSEPSVGAMSGRLLALSARITTSAPRTAARSSVARGCAVEVTAWAEHPHPMFLHGAQVGAARNQHHLAAAARQGRADIRADGPGSHHGNTQRSYALIWPRMPRRRSRR